MRTQAHSSHYNLLATHVATPARMSAVPTTVCHVMGCFSPNARAVMPVNTKVSELQMGDAMDMSALPNKKLYTMLPVWFTRNGTENRQFSSVRTMRMTKPYTPFSFTLPAGVVAAPAPTHAHAHMHTRARRHTPVQAPCIDAAARRVRLGRGRARIQRQWRRGYTHEPERRKGLVTPQMAATATKLNTTYASGSWCELLAATLAVSLMAVGQMCTVLPAIGGGPKFVLPSAARPDTHRALTPRARVCARFAHSSQLVTFAACVDSVTCARRNTCRLQLAHTNGARTGTQLQGGEVVTLYSCAHLLQLLYARCAWGRTR